MKAHLPRIPYLKRFTDQHGVERCYFRRGGALVPLPPPEHPLFESYYNGLIANDVVTTFPRQKTSKYEAQIAVYENVAKRMGYSAKARAKQMELQFDLAPDCIVHLLIASGGRCALTGLLLNFAKITDARSKMLLPSLDRITPGRGYVTGNVRVTCLAINYALNSWGEEAFAEVAKAFMECRDRPKKP